VEFDTLSAAENRPTLVDISAGDRLGQFLRQPTATLGVHSDQQSAGRDARLLSHKLCDARHVCPG